MCALLEFIAMWSLQIIIIIRALWQVPSSYRSSFRNVKSFLGCLAEYVSFFSISFSSLRINLYAMEYHIIKMLIFKVTLLQDRKESSFTKICGYILMEKGPSGKSRSKSCACIVLVQVHRCTLTYTCTRSLQGLVAGFSQMIKSDYVLPHQNSGPWLGRIW